MVRCRHNSQGWPSSVVILVAAAGQLSKSGNLRCQRAELPSPPPLLCVDLQGKVVIQAKPGEKLEVPDGVTLENKVTVTPFPFLGGSISSSEFIILIGELAAVGFLLCRKSTPTTASDVVLTRGTRSATFPDKLYINPSAPPSLPTMWMMIRRGEDDE